MNSLDRRKLRENYVELVRNLNPEDVTDYLYQEQVLSEDDIENIMSGATRAQRMRMFLAILPKKSKDGLIKLLEAMKRSGYIELADILEKPLSPDAINIQTGDHLTTPDSPTGAHGQISVFEDARLQELKEQLEQQSEVVASMQAEMEAVSWVALSETSIYTSLNCRLQIVRETILAYGVSLLKYTDSPF